MEKKAVKGTFDAIAVEDRKARQGRMKKRELLEERKLDEPHKVVKPSGKIGLEIADAALGIDVKTLE